MATEGQTIVEISPLAATRDEQLAFIHSLAGIVTDQKLTSLEYQGIKITKARHDLTVIAQNSGLPVDLSQMSELDKETLFWSAQQGI